MLQIQTNQAGVSFLSSPLLSRLGVPHGFSTRVGGVSQGPFASLNLGNPGGSAVQDDPANIAENYRRLLAASGLGGRRLCRIHQIHSSRVLKVAAGHEHDPALQGDALITDDRDSALSVRTADCIPLLLASNDGRWVAAVHAGWRGVVGGILPETLNHLAAQSGQAAADFVVAIGPGISAEAFEVGDEVAEQFHRAFGDAAVITRGEGGKAHVDLPGCLCLQARQCGVREDHLETTNCCTVRDAELFYSHRRDKGLTGRMAAVIGPRSSGAA